MNANRNLSKYKKVEAVFAAALVFIPQLFCAENIKLPEVTTVITGETEKADADALTSFDDAIKLPKGSGMVEPVLPELEPPVEEEVVPEPQPVPDKSVKIEGFAGGGYPMLFMGDASVTRTTDVNLFNINFNHNSSAGYTNHSLTDNFSDRTTILGISNVHQKNNFSWSFDGQYKTCADGLQGIVVLNNQTINLLNRDFYKAGGSASYEFSNGIITGVEAAFDFYNRYTEQACAFLPTFLYLEASPAAYIKWHGYGFETGFTADYLYSDEVSNTFGFKKGHRAEFELSLQWLNDFVKLYGNASAVVGNHLKEKPVIVPFTVGADFWIPVSFADSRLSIFAEGGIDSYRSGIHQLEEKYKFTAINSNTTETSDWYGRLCFSVPAMNWFTAKTLIEYRRTAYDNGVLEPDYKDDAALIYRFKEKEHQLLISEFEFLFNYENFNLSFIWHSNWLDVPALENMQSIKLYVEYTSASSRWGVNLYGSEGINSEFDIPEISVGGFVQITKAVRATISVNDIIKLYKGETRLYAGKYVSRGGSAVLLLNFVF